MKRGCAGPVGSPVEFGWLALVLSVAAGGDCFCVSRLIPLSFVLTLSALKNLGLESTTRGVLCRGHGVWL